MKTRFYFTLIFFLFFPIVFLSAQEVQSSEEISKTDAVKIVEKKIIKSNQEISYFISKDTIPAKTEIKTVDQPVLSPDYTSWLIFIDDEPFTNWGHKCRYVFVNVKTGQYTVLEQKLPPEMDMMEPIKELTIKKTQETAVEEKTDNERSKLSSVKSAASTNDNDNYAVIISGGMDSYNNWVRFWNDCSQIYKTLVNVYGYPDDHIYVLMSDGTNPANDRHLNDGSYDSSPLDLDGDGDNDVQYAATKANISYVFDQLSNTLNCNDNLFIFTTDHGEQVSGCDAKIIL